MAPKLYIINRSPPSRAVMMTAKAIGLALDIIRIDFTKGDNVTPEFLKMNPQHTVPTLDDDGVTIWDSHAINVYLVTKYAKDDSLYPKDPHKRAIIDQRLHFNSSFMYAIRRLLWRPILRGQAKSVPPEKAELMIENYEFLEKFLEGREWFAGDNVTLADICLIPMVTFNNLLVPIEEDKFPKLTAWIKKIKTLPYYEINEEGLKYSQQQYDDLRNA